MTDQQFPVCPKLPDETLSAFADGDLPPAESAKVRAHLAECPACTAVAGQLGSLARAARRLERPEPPPTLWLAVEGALEKPERPWWMSLRLFGVGALAGAAAVSLLALGLTSWRARRAELAAATPVAPPAALAARVAADPLLDEAEAELSRAAAAYEKSIEKLRALLEREQPRWSPDERARCADRLAQLDEAIAHSRELARRTPGDTLGTDQLFAAYRRKIDFLAEAVHRGGTFQQAAPEMRR